MADLSVELCGIKLSNPVIAASGCFGYGSEFAELYDINCLGSFAFKGTTRLPRFGNECPRIAECREGLLNSVGLQNPGIDAVLSEEMPKIKKIFSKKVMANICGFSVEDFAYCAMRADSCEQIGWLEINISCPNVTGGGMSFGTDPKAAAEVVKAVKKHTKKPVIMKLTPNVTDICDIAAACEDAGADGLSLINTLIGLRIDLKTRRPVLANETGGFSGRAIFPAALAAVYRVAKRVNIPLIGIGGISSARDVIEMMLAGATAVEVGSENLINPFACPEIIDALPAEAEKLGLSSLSELIGGAL